MSTYADFLARKTARVPQAGRDVDYEQYYQAIRRCYRYGQQRVVRAHVVLSDLEQQIAANVARKAVIESEVAALQGGAA